jgi:hypothetical protein
MSKDKKQFVGAVKIAEKNVQMTSKFQFYIVLGDWSSDGHGKSEKILIESNTPVSELQQAYKKSCKKTGISFHHDYPRLKAEKIEICTKYEESQMTDQIYHALKKINCPFDDLDFDGIGDDKITDENFDEIYFNSDSFLNLLMWFIGLSIEFEWQKVKESIPCFNGYWQKELNIQIGYGLYE